MLKSMPMDIVLVLIASCVLKWLIGPLLGREAMFAAAVLLAAGWVFLANRRHRLLKRFGAMLPRWRRGGATPR